MNTISILHYGHIFLMDSINDLPHEHWLTEGVCGHWSVKDIMAHLAVSEHTLIDVFKLLSGETDTPMINEIMALGADANDVLVERSKDRSSHDVLEDYLVSYEKSLELAEQCAPEKFSQNGILPWYGEEYDLDDFIVYSYYGHKREHGGQIAVFRDSLT
jgi:hypothetical protein